MKKLLTIIMFSIICMEFPVSAGVTQSIKDLASAAFYGAGTYIGVCAAVKYGLVTIPGFWFNFSGGHNDD